MMFFKLIAEIVDKKWCKEYRENRDLKHERRRMISSLGEEFNSRNRGCGITIFVSEINCDEITCGIITSGSEVSERIIKSFFKHIMIEFNRMRYEEVTIDRFKSICRRAESGEFITDEEEIFDMYGIGFLFRYCSVSFGENLIVPGISKNKLIDTAESLIAEDTLGPEIERIYAGSRNLSSYGHPVHYFIETDNLGTRKQLYYSLLTALYDNNRIKSRRYCYVDCEAGQHSFSEYDYENFYKTCIGGTVIVRFDADAETDEGEFASAMREKIRLLCEMLKKYRNQVLTVFCLPRTCERIKKIYREYLGSIGMVEIKENLADTDRAKEYLNRLCSENHIRKDKKLYEKLEDEKKYLPDDLYSIFGEWYNTKLRTSVFPQYSSIQVSSEKAIKEKAVGTAYESLNEMIGLSEAKDVINKALNYYKIQQIYRDKGMKQDRPAMHMVFTGNPGTAKTTVARLFARIMKENGLLSKGHLVEVGRNDLVGMFVGWTAPTVKRKFNEAKGGVLFIDEAYSLVDDRDGMYGDEAINTIVQEMENMRDDLVVIFAGYPKEMQKFLNKNPGLRSRIAFHVPFSDYNADELCSIAKLIGKSKGVTFTDGAYSKMHSVFESVSGQPDFGNGRYVRNLIELSKMNQAGRIATMKPENVTESILTTVEADDIAFPKCMTEPKTRKIGFN